MSSVPSSAAGTEDFLKLPGSECTRFPGEKLYSTQRNEEERRKGGGRNRDEEKSVLRGIVKTNRTRGSRARCNAENDEMGFRCFQLESSARKVSVCIGSRTCRTIK